MTTTAATNSKQVRIAKIAERVEEYWRELEEIATELAEAGSPDQALDHTVNLLSDAVTALDYVRLPA